MKHLVHCKAGIRQILESEDSSAQTTESNKFYSCHKSRANRTIEDKKKLVLSCKESCCEWRIVIEAYMCKGTPY